MKRIVVAMSGGVDSSVAAASLHKMGYEVIGITMKLYSSDSGCCSLKDITDARDVADKFGFEHHVINYTSRFKSSVIDYFVEAYKNGATPLPCTKCNQDVKFSDLLRATKMLGGEKLVTGHYARVVNGRLTAAMDPAKDQSYYLFPIRKEDFDVIEFPLGTYTKDEVRQIGKDLGIGIHDKKDSQDICFVQGMSYKDFLSTRMTIAPGEAVDKFGNVVGYHSGIANYTIGQRRGIRLGGNAERLYVVRIDASTNRIHVGSKDELMKKFVVLGDFNNICTKLNHGAFFKFRANQETIPSRVIHLSHDSKTAVVELVEPDYSGIAIGQAGVGYDNNVVIGGGWILDSGKTIADIEKHIN